MAATERRERTKGACAFCGTELTKSGMTKHLKACRKRKQAIEAVDAQDESPVQGLYHLLVAPAWPPLFWLHIEMNGRANLRDLDDYLRAIWLECCDHMSEFSIGGRRGREVSMRERIERVFEPAVELTHIYDFGTSSVTLINAIDVREGRPLTRHPIYLMARNNMPKSSCIECDAPADWLCMECVIERGRRGTLCDEHAKAHPHDDYGGPIPLVNSPRLGLCGYDGPATPPY